MRSPCAARSISCDELPAARAGLAAVGRVGAPLRLALADDGGRDAGTALAECAGRCGAPRRRRTTSGCPRCRRSPVDWSPPARCIAPVTPTSRSPFSDSDTDSGSISQAEAQRVDRRGAPHQFTGRSGHQRARRRDRRRSLAGGAGGRGGEVGHGIEAPPGAHQRADADAGVFDVVEFLDLAVARGHRLGASMHDAGVGIAGAGRDSRLDRRGRKVELSHAHRA